MAVFTRFLVLFPLILSLVAFVLTNLALFAGHQQGFMEDYAVIRLNTSELGQNILKDGKSSSKSGDDDDDGDESIFGKLMGKVDDLKDDAKDKLGDIAGDIIANIAEDLGISQWYSVHIMNACQGEFGANSTAAHFTLNTTNCTHSSPSNRFNLTEMLNHELSIGPLDINLADIDWPDSIEDKIRDLNSALLVLFVFFVLGVGFSGLSMLACIPALLLGDKKIILLTNGAFASLAATCIVLGSAVVTAASSIVASAINKAGEKISLVATTGTKFFTISWVAAVLMIITSLFWIGKFMMLWKREKRNREVYSIDKY
ncbi:actin cortical patch SUR7/pH-response regulator pali [Trichoderma austrokoningii]